MSACSSASSLGRASQLSYTQKPWWAKMVAVILWPMCCHTGMPCRRHTTRFPTLSQYTDTELICRCAIHWCEMSHWNTRLPISMSWVRPILPWQDLTTFVTRPCHTALIFCILRALSDWTRTLSMRPFIITDRLLKHLQTNVCTTPTIHLFNENPYKR